MARIVRPVNGRAKVWVPFRPGSGNYDLLKQICGEQTHPEYDSAEKCFKVARVHLGALIDELPAELGLPVTVTLHGATQTRCVEACWNANPDTFWDCVCSCASLYHGQGAGPPMDLGNGLAVGTEYTTHTFTAYP